MLPGAGFESSCAAACVPVALALAIVCALPAPRAAGQDFSVIGGNIQKRANGVLTLMAFSVAPDVTAGSTII